MIIPHEMIRASAGSGKTYALGLRYIRLLAQEQNPSAMAALTFTRKAAGEFLIHILGRLASAADDESSARRLAEEIGIQNGDTKDFIPLLRKMIDQMHILRLGTLDSHLNRVVQCLAPDLGLPGPPQLIEGYLLEQAQESSWRSVIREGDEEERRILLQVFAENSWGNESKMVQDTLVDYVRRQHQVYLCCPDESLWDDPYSATGRAIPYPTDGSGYPAVFEGIARLYHELEWTDFLHGKWADFLGVMENWQWGTPTPDGCRYLLDRWIKEWRAIREGSCEIRLYRKTYAFDSRQCGVLDAFLSQVMGSEIDRCRRQTRLIHHLIDRYERRYHRHYRSMGQLSFGDLPVLLGDLLPESVMEWIYFRLDGRTNHWMLDEFQDTSRAQWRALSGWIEEILQDPSRDRTFFCVGDVKQSIYGWRGGDPRLFDEIIERYGPVITTRNLDQSWRSGPAIVDTINRIFGNAAFMRESWNHGPVDRWHRIWSDHATSPATSGADDFVHVWEFSNRGLESRLPALTRYLTDLNPTERNLSCAVLLPTNRDVSMVVNHLRAAGIPASQEGEQPVAMDNQPGRFALACFQLTAHPDDRFCTAFLQMYPNFHTSPVGDRDLAAFIRESRVRISAEGFAATMKWILKGSGFDQATDPFHRQRWGQLLTLAANFDQIGDKDLHRFVEYMKGFRVRESSDHASVQVMTIHKSKGLGFDVVLLPELGGDGLESVRNPGLHAAEGDPGMIRWVFNLPRAEFCEADPELSAARQRLSDDLCFERFCRFYVAVTRAKRCLIMMTGPEPKTPGNVNIEAWIRGTLFDGRADPLDWEPEAKVRYQCGDPQWQGNYPLRPGEIAAAHEICETPATVGQPDPEDVEDELVKAVPSEHEPQPFSAPELLDPDELANERGSRIHDELAAIEWLTNEEAFPYPSIAAVFQKPAVNCEVWRERAFDIRTGRQWISGVFDRVHLHRNASGELKSAIIYDFKTDRITDRQSIDSKIKHYRPQLKQYRTALAKITGMAEESIETWLAFTEAGGESLQRVD